MATHDPLLGQQQQPATFDLSVIIEQRPSTNPWIETRREVVGVSATASQGDRGIGEPVRILQQGGVERYLVSGFPLRMHADECESYYHNLISPTPRCFVIANSDDEGEVTPFLVSLSFDEAHAYLEGEELVFAVDIPPELYRWSEAFVLTHYFPEKKTKRKLQDWSGNGPAGVGCE